MSTQSDHQMTPAQLRARIRTLREHQPLAVKFETELMTVGTGSRPWYRSQKEHWLGWLGDYDGPGFYNRRNWNRTAEFVFNHVMCPPMLIWLGEAAGVRRNVVLAAIRAARLTQANPASQCAAIRKAMPWGVVASKWRL